MCVGDRRPTPGHLEMIRAFVSCALPAIQTQLDTSADTKGRVRIEEVMGQIPPIALEQL